MPKYKIEFDRETCIGAFSCNAVNPEFWIKSNDGKVNLRDAKYNPEIKKFELIIEEKDLEINKEAESVCPVMAIKVSKVED